MNPARPKPLSAWLFAVGLLLWVSSALAGPGPMQVEEPGIGESRPPIQPEKDQASWKDKKNASLTPDQKAALKNRQQTMRDMMHLIQQKRRALREARPEDRRALAQELHNLILEKAQEAGRGRGLDRGMRKPDARSSGKDEPEDASDKAARMRDAPQAGDPDKLIRQHDQVEAVQRQQELRRKAVEEKLKQQENRGNGDENGRDD